MIVSQSIIIPTDFKNFSFWATLDFEQFSPFLKLKQNIKIFFTKAGLLSILGTLKKKFLMFSNFCYSKSQNLVHLILANNKAKNPL